jgi:hypothetical protein
MPTSASARKHRISKEIIQEEREIYWQRLRRAHEETLLHLNQLKNTWSQTDLLVDNIRIREDIERVLNDYKSCSLLKPLLFEEYENRCIKGTITDSSGVFLYLSAKQARVFFRGGRPRVPVVVQSRLLSDQGYLM